MSFVVQRVTARGLIVNQINVDSLRIGRGTSAELRSENPAVSLEHAVVDEDDSGFTITDRGSITGTYVNRRPVETARLAKGDVIEIGDLRIEVQLAEPDRPLFLRIAPTATHVPIIAGEGEEDEEAEEEAAVATPGGTVRAPVIDYVREYRLKRVWLTKLSLIALISIITLTVTSELLTPEKQRAFMPGGVSSAHGRARDAGGAPIAAKCNACHTPWRGVTSEQCRSCHNHNKGPHAENLRDEPPCISCHAEHRSAVKLSMIGESACVPCHSDLTTHVKDAGLGPGLLSSHVHIRAFGGDHPEFTPIADNDTLLFNHKLHLDARGIFNASGRREILACTTCHAFVADPKSGKADPKPIRFATDCQRCHKLTFDARFPDREVPHGGDPDIVYGAIFTAHSGQGSFTNKSPDEIRRILTSQAQRITTDQTAVIDAEHVIKTKCQKCHEIRRTGTRLTVTPPVLPTRWLMHAKFTHGAAHTKCESCHETARRSSVTTEVLIPARSACVTCHGTEGGGIPSSCGTCHDYHDRSKILPDRKPVVPAPLVSRGDITGMLGTVLLCAIVLLLLVVLIPIGIVTYQRFRPRTDDRPPQRAAAPPPPPINLPPPAPAPSPAGPTEKIPAVTAPPPARPPAAAPAPPPAPPSDADATRVVKTADLLGGGVVGGTEVVEWYGLILWTSGPLEGKRMVVEPKGFYVGRDPNLADVVIPDGRVSKRHLRLVPRDGRAHVIDDGSTNGTYLASNPGVRITDIELKRGDTIVLGDGAATFVYQI